MREGKLGSGNQEVFTSAGKNTDIVLVLCLTWKYVFTAGPGGTDISEGHKNYFKDWCLMNSQPTFLILTYFLTQGNSYIIKST